MKAPYIVAEIGLNHEGSASRAADMIYECAQAGANAAKFQAVRADTLVSKTAPTYFHQEGVQAQTQHEFFARVKPFTEAEWGYLKWCCDRNNIDFGVTAFTPEDVAWVDPLVKWHKVASADITNLPLLEAVNVAARRENKTVYLSTGAATIEEVEAAWKCLCDCNVTVLHCVLSYPTPPDAASLEVINELRAEYGAAGYSDHTLFNLDVLTTAWLLGAQVIEKHFTLDKSLPGNDHYHSMDPTDLRVLVAKFQELQAMIGDGEKRVLKIEEPARLYARRGLYAARDIAEGKILEAADIAILRPSANLGPERYCDVIGQPIPQARVAGEPL